MGLMLMASLPGSALHHHAWQDSPDSVPRSHLENCGSLTYPPAKVYPHAMQCCERHCPHAGACGVCGLRLCLWSANLALQPPDVMCCCLDLPPHACMSVFMQVYAGALEFPSGNLSVDPTFYFGEELQAVCALICMPCYRFPKCVLINDRGNCVEVCPCSPKGCLAMVMLWTCPIAP